MKQFNYKRACIALLIYSLFTTVYAIFYDCKQYYTEQELSEYKEGQYYLTDQQYANYSTLPFKMELIQAYERYMDATQNYLKEIDAYYDINQGSDEEEAYYESLDYIRELYDVQE